MSKCNICGLYEDMCSCGKSYKQAKCKPCHCDIDSALYMDMEIVKCQYCSGAVNEERATKYIKYNSN